MVAFRRLQAFPKRASSLTSLKIIARDEGVQGEGAEGFLELLQLFCSSNADVCARLHSVTSLIIEVGVPALSVF